MLVLPKVSIQKKNKWSHCFAHSSKITGLFSLFLLQAFFVIQSCHKSFFQKDFPFFGLKFFIILFGKNPLSFFWRKLVDLILWKKFDLKKNNLKKTQKNLFWYVLNPPLEGMESKYGCRLVIYNIYSEKRNLFWKDECPSYILIPKKYIFEVNFGS